MDIPYTDIARALQDYFDGLYRSDTRLLARIFHPNAKRFTDFLTLVRLDGRWRILSKVFHYNCRRHDPCPT